MAVAIHRQGQSMSGIYLYSDNYFALQEALHDVRELPGNGAG